MKRKNLLIVLTLFFIISSCKTYIIPVDSFKEQLIGIDSSKMKDVIVLGPFGERYYYQANKIENIKCIDKNGNPFVLNNGPSIEIRVTHGEKNKRTIFYFDSVHANDSSFAGMRSRFIPTLTKSIPFNDISKIEIQDGKKKVNYSDY